MTYNHRTNPINLKDNHKQTISEQFPAFNPPLHTNMGWPRSLSRVMQRGPGLWFQTTAGAGQRGQPLWWCRRGALSEAQGFLLSESRPPGHNQQAKDWHQTNTLPKRKQGSAAMSWSTESTETREPHRECQHTRNLSLAGLKSLKWSATDVHHKAQTNSTALTQSSWCFCFSKTDPVLIWMPIYAISTNLIPMPQSSFK